MSSYKEIINNYLKISYFAGDKENEHSAQEKSRKSFIEALGIRKKECQLRSNIAISLLIAAMLFLVYFILFQPGSLKTFKELMSLIGGGSIAGLLFYIISVRDEITKINQTLIIAPAVEKAVLDTMLLTLMGK